MRNGIQTASFANQFTKQNLAFNEPRHFSGEVKPSIKAAYRFCYLDIFIVL
ncbi:hypothetical protein TPHV1_350007 [Treponema phagedenis]|uniref:Uncharacterized protein n=1 Tax=Treponema phagedenis TaxID=162 RepID=A0A0B7H0K7_TREPH|nr:hypothetical protein TPHV1_350007 [Treponema phagedenis]